MSSIAALCVMHGYAGVYISADDWSGRSRSDDTDLIRVGERTDDPDVVAHELAHAWASDRTMAHPWLWEGYAEWAARTSLGRFCDRLGDYPGKGSPRLSRWRFLGARPTKADQEVVAFQYAAACSIAARVAEALGERRQADLVRAIIAATPPYGGRPDRRPAPVDWRAWLDAVDELGFARYGDDDATLGSDLLTEFGVARGKDLARRADARAAYHEARLATPGWRLPVFIRDLMEDWRFGPATEALPLATETAELVRAALATVTSIDRARALEARYAAAGSVKELRQLREALSEA